jgi:hypothetical protein
MKKVYVIEEISNADRKKVGHNVEYRLFGFFTNKLKAEEFLKKGEPIEKVTQLGYSYTPKKFVNKYRMTELNSL